MADSASPWEKVDDALKQLSDALDAAFTSIGETLRDPDLRAQVKETANSLASAVSTTVHDVTDDVKQRFRAAKDATEDDGPGAGAS
jgi:ElaB/YqjD/DUF883 family membrane-anchored ribosome-binding protein